MPRVHLLSVQIIGVAVLALSSIGALWFASAKLRSPADIGASTIPLLTWVALVFASPFLIYCVLTGNRQKGIRRHLARSVPVATAVILIDLLLFAAAYILHSTAVRTWTLANASSLAGYAVAARVIYLQVGLQIAGLSFAFALCSRFQIILTPLVAAAATVLSFLGVFGMRREVFNLFSVSVLDWNLSEGGVILLSSSVAALIVLNTSRAFRPQQYVRTP